MSDRLTLNVLNEISEALSLMDRYVSVIQETHTELLDLHDRISTAGSLSPELEKELRDVAALAGKVLDQIR